MPLYRSNAFVLRTYKLGEADQIVVFFTQEFGKLRVAVRSSRNARRATAGYYQPLTLLHAIVFGRPNQALYRMHSIDAVQLFRPLQEDFDRLRCGLYLTELLDVSTREREPAPELFDLFHHTLEALVHAPVPALLLRLFELRLALLIGYAPQLQECARCSTALPLDAAAFNVRLGGVMCPACAPEVPQTFPIAPETLAYLRQTLRSEALPTTTPDGVVQQELEHLLHLHLTAHLGRDLKSYAFLHL